MGRSFRDWHLQLHNFSSSLIKQCIALLPVTACCYLLVGYIIDKQLLFSSIYIFFLKVTVCWMGLTLQQVLCLRWSVPIFSELSAQVARTSLTLLFSNELQSSLLQPSTKFGKMLLVYLNLHLVVLEGSTGKLVRKGWSLFLPFLLFLELPQQVKYLLEFSPHPKWNLLRCPASVFFPLKLNIAAIPIFQWIPHIYKCSARTILF